MNHIKEYLSQLKYLNQEIQSYTEQRNALRSAIEIKTSSFNENKVQETNKRFDDKYMKFVEISEQLNDKIDERMNLQVKITNEIDLIDKQELRLVLRYKYINLLTFEQIAVKMSYDIRSVHRIHGNALKEFEDIQSCH